MPALHSTLHAALVAWGLSLGGMAALAFAMDRHYAQLTGALEAPALRRHGLRLAGAALLLGAVVPCVLHWGASVGAVAVLGFWSMGALLVAGGLAARARGVAMAALLAVALSLGAMGMEMEWLW